MPRSSFGLTSLWGGLAVLSLCGTASAQWFSGNRGGSCGCSAPSYMGQAPIMRQSASAFGAAPMMPVSYASDGQCGPPICRIEQPQQMQVVHVQAVAPVQHTVVAVQQLRPVVQAVMQDVPVTEYQAVKRTVSKPVMTTEFVDQAVTVMTPVSETRTANVPTVDYQTVTEYRTVQKQVGYWATKTVPTGKVNAWQYDNRPNMAGAMNRASYNMRTAFTPTNRATRTFVPQTMTCQVPYCRKVAVPGMKQVTYNTTRMQATQTTRRVAVNKMSYQTAEVTVMAPVQVVKTMQVGTRVSYAPAGTTGPAIGSAPATPGGGGIGLAPTPDPTSSQRRTADPSNSMDPNKINREGASLETYDAFGNRVSQASEQPVKTFSAQATSAPSVVRVSLWVARTPSPSSPQPGGKSAAIAIADSTR